MQPRHNIEFETLTFNMKKQVTKMKKLTLIAAMSTLSAFSQAYEFELLGTYENVNVAQYIDEFDNKVAQCHLAAGVYGKNEATLQIVAYPKNFDNKSLIMYATANKKEASGFQFKIDDGAIIKKGRTKTGGDTHYEVVNISILDEIANGKEIVLRAYPENIYYDEVTKRYNLQGSKKAVQTFLACAKKK